MNRKQILRFIKKADLLIYRNLHLIMFQDPPLTDHFAFVEYDEQCGGIHVLFLNEDQMKQPYITKNNYAIAKAALLHEIGHIILKHTLDVPEIEEMNKRVLREYDAQLWSIERAKELHMTAIQQTSLNILARWRNSKKTIYRKTYEMAVQFQTFERYQQT